MREIRILFASVRYCWPHPSVCSLCQASPSADGKHTLQLTRPRKPTSNPTLQVSQQSNLCSYLTGPPNPDPCFDLLYSTQALLSHSLMIASSKKALSANQLLPPSLTGRRLPCSNLTWTSCESEGPCQRRTGSGRQSVSNTVWIMPMLVQFNSGTLSNASPIRESPPPYKTW